MDTDETAAARRIGEVLGGKWTLERLIGTGGMAAVYAARDAAGNVAAVKLLHPEMTLKRDVRERFLREAYVANRVDHPGAVRVLEHGGGDDGAPAYIVMELLEGQTLSDRVKSGIGTAELLDAMDQVLDVLDHAHGQGIVHRDLKPDNLFVCSDGRVKILDFGLARMLDEVPGDFKTRTGMALGTLPYMAPEQALGRRDELDGRADLFALGATAFRIASGRKLHEAPSEAELLMAMASKPAPPLASVAPGVPSDVCAIIDLAVAFSKDARYPDARTMQSDVRDVRAGRPPAFASSRSSRREEATRLDMPAVAPPPSTRSAVGATMPLAAVAEMAPADAPPPSSYAAAAMPAAVAVPAPQAVAPAPRRRSIAPFVVAAVVLLALAGAGIAAILMMSGSTPGAASAAAGPASPAAATAAADPSGATPATAEAAGALLNAGTSAEQAAHAAAHDTAAAPAGAAEATPAPKPTTAAVAATGPAPAKPTSSPASAPAAPATTAAPAPAPKPAPAPPPAPKPAPAPPPPPAHGHSGDAHGHGPGKGH